MNLIEDLLEDTVKHLEQEFYQKKFRFSYSSLNKLLFSPPVFYQLYILGNKEDKIESYLQEGRVIHCLLLDKDAFDKNFIVSPVSFPTASSKKVIDILFHRNKGLLSQNPELDITDFRENILEIMKEVNYFQTLKSDNDRLNKLINSETTNYFDFLKQKGTKDLIDQETLTYCEDAVSIIKQNPYIVELLGLDEDDFSTKEIYNEKYLEGEIQGLSFGFKGIVDNINIDHEKKVITINDLKTTSKSLKDFKESIEFYAYWLQAIIYMILVSQNHFNLLDKGYIVKFNFVVIDKYFNTYAFPVSDKTRQEWMERFNEVVKIAQYHYDNNRYDLPYEFDNGLVIL